MAKPESDELTIEFGTDDAQPELFPPQERVRCVVTDTIIHDSLPAGDSITVAGPYGTVIGDPGTETPALCLASGSGLAPILALTDAALRRGFDRPVTISPGRCALRAGQGGSAVPSVRRSGGATRAAIVCGGAVHLV